MTAQKLQSTNKIDRRNSKFKSTARIGLLRCGYKGGSPVSVLQVIPTNRIGDSPSRRKVCWKGFQTGTDDDESFGAVRRPVDARRKSVQATTDVFSAVDNQLSICSWFTTPACCDTSLPCANTAKFG